MFFLNDKFYRPNYERLLANFWDNLTEMLQGREVAAKD